MKTYSDFELRTEIKKLKKEKKHTEAKKLLLSRIDENFFKKSSVHEDYCSQTFTAYFTKELIKLFIQLGEKEKALHVFKQGLKLPYLKREDEIAFSLSIQSIYPQIAKQYIPGYKIKTIERKVVSKKGKQKFLGKNGKELFVEEIALEYYRYNGNWHGIWLIPTTESLYFKRLRQTIGLGNYKKLTSNAMNNMGHICNLCYGAPDLILYKGFIRKIGKSVEVKGLKDKLFAAQLVWIEQFNKLHLGFEVLQVKEKK